MAALALCARAQGLRVASEDQAKDLLVMLTTTFAEGEVASKAGAGIIFAHKNNRVYMATARHTLWSGPNASRSQRVQFKWLPGQSWPATKAEGHEDAVLDLAVLIVGKANELSIPALPFQNVGDAAALRRGDPVRRMGYPFERGWFSRPSPDTVAETNDEFIGFDGQLHEGYSGGGLFDGNWRLVGMLKQDSPPNGEATSWDRIERRLRGWGYVVDLGRKADPTPPINVPPPKTGEASAGEVRLNKDDGLPYAWIPPGEFTLGCSPGDKECRDDEKPMAGVRITKGFWMGQTEVTVEAYRRFAKAMPQETTLNPGWKDGRQPIVNVSWDEAKRYCEEGAKGRLPTEAEWEYAARAGSTASRYDTSLDKIAWYRDNSGGKIHAVGDKGKNLWSLHDMLGNVWEWVADWYQSDYYQKLRTAQLKIDPKGPPDGTPRVVRGGVCFGVPSDVRVSCRNGYHPEFRNYSLGIRCAREVISP